MKDLKPINCNILMGHFISNNISQYSPRSQKEKILHMVRGHEQQCICSLTTVEQLIIVWEFTTMSQTKYSEIQVIQK